MQAVRVRVRVRAGCARREVGGGQVRGGGGEPARRLGGSRVILRVGLGIGLEA